MSHDDILSWLGIIYIITACIVTPLMVRYIKQIDGTWGELFKLSVLCLLPIANTALLIAVIAVNLHVYKIWDEPVFKRKDDNT